MTNYTKEITKKFYEANPDLLKLEFGCEVTDDGVMISDDVVLYGNPHSYGDGSILETTDFLDEEILGKPITVLQAISLFRDSDVSWNITYFGDSAMLYLEEDAIHLDPTIALFKDLPDETQEKIYKLID